VPWVTFDFDTDAYVRLHFRRGAALDRTRRPRTKASACCSIAGHPGAGPLLPAARPVMRWLALPSGWVRPPAAAATESAQPREHWIDGARWLAPRTRRRRPDAGVASGSDFVLAAARSERDLAALCGRTPIPVYAADPATRTRWSACSALALTVWIVERPADGITRRSASRRSRFAPQLQRIATVRRRKLRACWPRVTRSSNETDCG